MDLKDVSTQSAEIRSRYHDLERQRRCVSFSD